MSQSIPQHVAVHPLVLLSVVDHFNRVVQKNREQRVVGILLGEKNQGTLDITNSFALPFEEDPKEPGIWFVDHFYFEQMHIMFRKINTKEKAVGWYTTGNKFKQHDIQINELFRKYINNPVLVIIDVQHQDELALPTEAYCAIQEVAESGQIIKSFQHVPSSVEAFEAEEVGVEHLVRDIKDISLNSLSNNVNQKVKSLKGLVEKMQLIKSYLQDALDNKIKINNKILFNLQEIFNLLPNLNNEDIIRAFFVKNNDMMFMLYVCSIIRSTIALHDLISNKISIKDQEKQLTQTGENKDKEAKTTSSATDKDAKNKEGTTEKNDKEDKKDKDNNQ